MDDEPIIIALEDLSQRIIAQEARLQKLINSTENFTELSDYFLRLEERARDVIYANTPIAVAELEQTIIELDTYRNSID